MIMSNNRREQLINQQRKRLQQLRLQTQSENTKLLKIQQKERQVQAEYQNEKRNMQQTLEKLIKQAEVFTQKQAQIKNDFESQKQQIFANDRKKQSYLQQKQDLELRNKKRRDQIQNKEKSLRIMKDELEEIRTNIKKYQIYEEFLREVKNLSDDFDGSQLDQFGVMSILDRYDSMTKRKNQLKQLHKQLQKSKETKAKHIQRVKKQRQEKILYYNSVIKEFKQKIDNLNEENIQLESDLQGKLNENGERQRQIGQVIFSIRGLYQSIIGEDKPVTKTTLEMLSTIKEQRKKLKEYLDLFQQRTQERKKN